LVAPWKGGGEGLQKTKGRADKEIKKMKRKRLDLDQLEKRELGRGNLWR